MVKDKKRKKRNIYNGYSFASGLEVRMAKILVRNRIGYTPHVVFEVNGNNGNGRKTREVDFVLDEWIKPFWSSNPICAIEVKGWLTLSDWERRKELEAINIPTFIATAPIIDFWDKEKFIEYRISEIQMAGHFRQDNRRNNNRGSNGRKTNNNKNKINN